MHHGSNDLKHGFERGAANERIRPVHELACTELYFLRDSPLPYTSGNFERPVDR